MDLPQYQTLTLRLDQQVATVCLNRPDKANSMDPAMWRELPQCFAWLDAEPAVRAVILAGEGRHFCAGIDLAMFGELHSDSPDPARRAEQFRSTVLRMQDSLTALETCRKPVLAAIHGACIGGGVDLTCCADMRYAAENASFSIREVDLGMTADVGTLQRLPGLIPPGVVRELAYTGREMDAEEACERGFVNRVYPDRDTLLEEVAVIARQIAGKSPLAVRGTKAMLLYARDHSVADGLNHVATWNAGMLSQQDVAEGIAAQAEKRVARYPD
jgi:enoyl-CoA hydratase